MRMYGQSKLREYIRKHIALAHEFEVTNFQRYNISIFINDILIMDLLAKNFLFFRH